jgi:hypothetical protein
MVVTAEAMDVDPSGRAFGAVGLLRSGAPLRGVGRPSVVGLSAFAFGSAGQWGSLRSVGVISGDRKVGPTAPKERPYARGAPPAEGRPSYRPSIENAISTLPGIPPMKA